MDIGGRAFTGAKHDQRTREPVDIMWHPSCTKSNLADKKRFLKFIMEFQEGNFAFKYRDALKRNYLRKEYKLEINTRDLAGYDEQLADKLKESPWEMMPWFEEAAKEAADEVTFPRGDGETNLEDIHVNFISVETLTSVRDLKTRVSRSPNWSRFPA